MMALKECILKDLTVRTAETSAFGNGSEAAIKTQITETWSRN